MRGIHRSPVNSPYKRPVTRKMFPFDDIIMVIIYIQNISTYVHLKQYLGQFHKNPVVYKNKLLYLHKSNSRAKSCFPRYIQGLLRFRWYTETLTLFVQNAGGPYVDYWWSEFPLPVPSCWTLPSRWAWSMTMGDLRTEFIVMIVVPLKTEHVNEISRNVMHHALTPWTIITLKLGMRFYQTKSIPIFKLWFL